MTTKHTQKVSQPISTANCWTSVFRLTLTLVLFTLLGSLNLSAQVAPVIDGLTNDWNSANFNSFPVRKYQVDNYGNTVDNQFTGGSKDFFQTNQLVWSIGQTKNKGDLANGAAILDIAAQKLYFAGDRIDNNGTAQIGFWLYLNGSGPVVTPDGNIFTPDHAVGDLLILANFVSGGRTAELKIYQWLNTIHPSTGTNLQDVTASLLGSIVVARNNETIGFTQPVPSLFTANFPGSTYAYNQFFEGSIDLTALPVPLGDLCKTSFLLETRSSQTLDASLEDFIATSFDATPNPLVLSSNVFCTSSASTGTIISTTSQTGFSYQLFTSAGVAVGSPKTGSDGVALSWTNVPVGNGYYVVGKSINNCSSTSNTVNVVSSTVTLTATGIDPNCFGQNGTINFSAISSNGGTITYRVNGITATSPFTATASGTYTIVATNANGCTDTKQVIITIPTQLVASSVPGTIDCKGGTTTVVVSAVGGTAPYTGTGTFTVSAGAYSYTVTDAKGCTSTTTGSISEPSRLVASSEAGTINCKGGTTTVVVSATGGTAPYTGTGTFTVSAGAYSYTVTDAKGCTSVTSGTITEPAQLVASNTQVDVLCFGASTGSIDLTVSGGTAPYTYSWSNSKSTEDINELAAGTYSVLVTDAKGCTATSAATITQQPDFTVTANDNTLCADKKVQLTATPVGGIWSGAYVSASGEFDATGLAAGVYTVTYTYTNDKGCVKSDNASVTVNPNPSCIIAGGNPGNAPYCVGNGLPAPTGLYFGPAGMSSYKWTAAGAIDIIGDDASQNVTIQVNGVGTLSLTVTNQFGCVSTCQQSVLVRSGAPCSLNGPEKVCAETENVYTDESSSADGTTFLWSLVDGSGNPVDYDVAHFVGSTDGPSVTVKVGVNGGSYVVRLFKEEPDACPSICEVETVVIPKVYLTAKGTEPKCFGAEGKLEFSAEGGTGAITYTVNAVSATSPYVALAGSYTIVAADENGCTADTTITLAEPAKLLASATKVDVKCNGAFTGSVDLTVSGGTAPYSYTWSNSETTEDISNLAAGTYTVTVKDVNQCVATTSATITEPDALIASSSAGSIVCNGGTTTVTVSAVGGKAPYTGTGSFTVGAGTYTYTVIDDNGCTASTTIVVNQPSAVVLTASGPAELCTTETGSITFSAAGGTGTISYTVNGVSATSPYSAASGTYTIVAKDANNCTDTKVVTIASKVCAVPYCTYTQGYFGNPGGKSCTPDGQKTTAQLIAGSLANMPGGVLYLGKAGRSFTTSSVNDIIRILPGGGTPNQLPAGNHTPSSNLIISRGRINNVLLSQTMALALNTYMQGSTIKSLSLAEGSGSSDKFLVTVAKQGGDCSSLSTAVPAGCRFSPVYCSDGVTISSYQITFNPYQSRRISSKVINELSGDKTVLDLLNFASAILGGAPLPSGVSYSDVAGAVTAINEAFDGCRLFIGFASTSSVSGYCTPPAGSACPAPLITTRTRTNTSVAPVSVELKELTMNAYPNPFREQLNFRFVSPVSGKAVLEVFNVHGQRLGIVFEGNITAGSQNFARFTNEGANGMLIYKLSVGDQVLTGKVQSLK